jgi:signal transduction histidine kinase
LRQRTQHIYERLRPNGRVLKSIGNPMPGGGYVTSFTDITAEKTAQDALRAANEHLEARVLERTAALSAVNAELGAAKSAAEQATQGKTRFLAAASHDLLQPLNAARLFSAALDGVIEDSNDEARQLARSVERSIAAADSLLRALLDISKLDAGGVTPSKQPFALDGLLADLTDQFAPVAAAKGLRLQRVATGLWINSDRALLRSALQNFLSNALRYTEAGGVLVGARRRGDRVVIEVWDTGCGIPEGQRSAIFREFHRLHAATDESAAGLGLAIVERIARILGASLDLRSTVGRGSVFSIDASLAASPPNLVPKEAASVARRRLDLRVLCVDNETDILVALEALLSTWEARGILAKSYAEACSSIERDDIDVALIDYHLGEEKNGLDVIAAWRARFGARPFAVVTASRSDAIEQQVTAAGGIVLYKPVDPQALVAFLSAVTMHA